MIPRPTLLTALVSLLALPLVAAAQTAYVSDQLEINLRRGQGTQFGIRATPDSGTPLEVLETDRESGYTRVRTPGGIEGWVLTRYLQDEPVARERLAAARQAQRTAEATAEQAQAQLGDVQSENARLTARVQTVEQEASELQAELRRVSAAAARPMEIQRQNAKLTDQVRTLEQERDRLSMKLRSEQSQRENWITGAVILFVGLVAGLIAPHLRRRRSGWEGLG